MILMVPPPFDAGERNDRDLEQQAEMDEYRLSHKIATVSRGPNIERVDLHTCADFLTQPYDVYIGRYGFYWQQKKVLPQSKYRNPYSLKQYRRSAAIMRFQQEIAPTLDVSALVKIYQIHGRLRLGCWCKSTEECHGDTVIELVKKKIMEE